MSRNASTDPDICIDRTRPDRPQLARHVHSERQAPVAVLRWLGKTRRFNREREQACVSWAASDRAGVPTLAEVRSALSERALVIV
jgi:hypothetical protein